MVMFSVLIFHHTMAEACNRVFLNLIYYDQYCTATIYSATSSARGKHTSLRIPK